MLKLGQIFKIIGWIIFAITGVWGFILCLAIITKAAGFWGVVIGLMICPVTFVAAPLYAGFAWHDWFPLILNYGGSIVATFFWGIGYFIDE